MQQTKPYEYMLVEDFFTQEELSVVWDDLAITFARSLWQPRSLGQNEPSMVSRSGLFLDKENNHLLQGVTKSVDKLFDGYTSTFAEMCFANYPVINTNRHSMLCSLYTNTGFYKKHRDTSVTSALIWLCKEPKSFTGGDLILHDLDETIPFKNNTMIMFPSQAFHEVTPVVMDESLSAIEGRICLSIFMSN
jgi:Rps23 Pro-64 3,4-dihydroxylase Tpa1-like proline 4-hydroxylase